jgi:hypothetical protein
MNKDKELEKKDQEIEKLHGRLDDKDNELGYKRCTIELLELELMEFNADNSKFLLEYELVEEKERSTRL